MIGVDGKNYVRLIASFNLSVRNHQQAPEAFSGQPPPTDAGVILTHEDLVMMGENSSLIGQEYVAPTRNTRSARKRAQSLTNHRANFQVDI